MEQWRERGYVPDSDEEDEWETQEPNELVQTETEPKARDTYLTASCEKPTSDDISENRGYDNQIESQVDALSRPPGGQSVLQHSTLEELDELDDDPLQGDADLFARPTKTVKDSHSSRPQGRVHQDPPSSPDELQFDEHLPAQIPTTPIVKAVASFNEDLGVASDNSSFLSSPPSTIVSPWSTKSAEVECSRTHLDRDGVTTREEDITLEEIPDNPPLNNFLQNEANACEDVIPLDELPEDVSNPFVQHGRSLRQRNAIQLHPYLLENAKYQRLVKARGLQPVRVNIVDHAPRKEAAESQSQPYQDENVPPSSSPDESFQLPPSSPGLLEQPNSRPTPSPLTTCRQGKTVNKYNDEKWISKTVQNSTARPVKRRKISHDHENDKSTTQDVPQESVVVLVNNTTTPAQSTSIFDIPLSPPPSGSLSSAGSIQEIQDVNEFRFPHGMMPIPMATPATEARTNTNAHRALFAELLAESESESESDNVAKPTQRVDSDSNSDSSKASSTELRRMRRKIKGVLPASWLRLDLQEHERRAKDIAEKERLKSVHLQRDNGKGVARKISKTDRDRTRTRRQRPEAFLISDDSCSDIQTAEAASISHKLPSVSRETNPSEGFLMGLGEEDDIPEDNRIDYMYPSVPRRSISSGKRRPLGSTNIRKGNRGSTHLVPQGPKSDLKRQSRITDAVTRQSRTRMTRLRIPRLGILDAPDLGSISQKDQPQFLRIAARCARKRLDHARQSPTRKFFRLGNRDDTQDVNNTLREWKKGAITRRAPVARRENANSCPSNAGISDDCRRTPTLENNNDINTLSDTSMGNVSRDDTGSSIDRRPEGQTQRNIVDLTAPQNEAGLTSTRTPQKAQVKQSRLARHGFVVSSFRRNVPRPVGLDNSANLSFDTERPQSHFQKTLFALNEHYRRSERSDRLPLTRFLSHSARTTPKVIERIHPPITTTSDVQILPSKSRLPIKRPRKRKPCRLDAEAVEYRQPLEHDLNIIQAGSVKSVEITGSRPLKGLQTTVQIYTIDFDTFPLQTGTYFHESTFVGSGEFHRSLNILSRDFDVYCGQSAIIDGDHVYRWGSWNDMLSSQLGGVLEKIVAVSWTPGASYRDVWVDSSSTLQLYRSVIQFISNRLSFGDPVDRKLFVERCLPILSGFLDWSRTYIPDAQNLEDLENYTRLEMLSLVLANQIQQLASHELVDSTKRTEANSLVRDFGIQIFQTILSPPGIACIRHFLEDNKRLHKREAGIRQEYPLVEAYLVARYILSSQNRSARPTTDELISKALSSSIKIESLDHVVDMERLWHSLFSILPLDEFDDLGIFHPGLRFKDCEGHWPIVTQLISKVFGFYEADREAQKPAFNKYVRALLHRCFHLIKGWGWKHCKPLLEMLFDFFARNLFHNLTNEDENGSPSFLDDLDKNPALDVESRDTCFHIFLKIVGTGLSCITSLQDYKKTRNIAWRLLPNHGRLYPKEQPLRQDDLDALRNHHDLLCTLYWAVPDGCRPQLKTLRYLVPPATSHKEACIINIHAWSRLVRFKLSTSEDSDLVDFAIWHSDFTTELLKQHSLARTELEHAAISASTFARQSVESAIGKNQRQIESLLNSALTGMKQALNTAKSMSRTMILMERLPVEKLLGLFNPSIKRLNGVVCQTLELLYTYSTMEMVQTQKPQASIEPSEDSQEYGDWVGFEEVYDQQMDITDPAILYIDSSVRPALFQFISRVFGEDLAPDDTVLVKAIDTWIGVSATLVKHRLRQWTSYLSLYDGDSWASLRTTDQTRRFMPYFLAKLVSTDPGTLADCRSRILNYWVESLAERGSMLKFQHELTTAILNNCREDPLFDNLPFSVDRMSGVYEIFLEDFCQRRVSLLSCLLSNMREHLARLEERNHSDMRITTEYCEMIKTLMATMRRNYEELGSPNTPVHGSYVDFVHRAVGFLQQHSQNICPIDEFFMDPRSFPLPASDPTYVVAKMKSYGVRLSVAKIAKQLVMFVQNVSERAAVDGHQAYLVDQFYKAMDHTYCEKDYRQPYLRAFLLNCVLPAYVENAFSNPVGWILVRPLLQSTTRIFADLLLDVDTANSDCASLVMDSILVYFDSVERALQLLTDHPGLLEEASVLLTLTSFLETILASLPLVDYLYQISDQAARFIKMILHKGSWSRRATSISTPVLLIAGTGCFTAYTITEKRP
ncbi:predicted protein [Uncinocarpus reesii 1704]|uniref:Mus7/MMS22 family-domain-containing protein n=1 Tax=Uncinocarpus reesii (strain UAMH 1704) TaxID=336963 RepID=C4JV46_UNCRE|nr:uncharacterized protein UREG_06438 [Uncinocarpus reesii 1704]EEP81573.1 predicted protein [Uncinocarpus reesii 1704]